MSQNTVQNSSLLIFEDVIAYIAEYSSAVTTLNELSSAIARELYSRNLHSPPSTVCYSDY